MNAIRKSTRIAFWQTLQRALPGWRHPVEPDQFCDQLDFYHPDGHRLFFQFHRRRFGLVIAGEFNTDLYWNGGGRGTFFGPGCTKRLEAELAEVLAEYSIKPMPLCPDQGTCHHGCRESCWRVANCGPLSGVFPNNEWPSDLKGGTP